MIHTTNQIVALQFPVIKLPPYNDNGKSEIPVVCNIRYFGIHANNGQLFNWKYFKIKLKLVLII